MGRNTIRTAVQNLIGGVSQQPNSVRLESMCEEQINGYTSIVDGLGKRQPTEHVKKLLGTTWTKDSHVHWINRQPSERYVVILNPEDQPLTPIDVYDLNTGKQIPVTGINGSSILGVVTDYLKSGVTKSRLDLRVLTVADTTIIVNRKVTCKIDENTVHDAINLNPSLQPIWESLSTRRAFLFMKSSNFLTKYAVRLNAFTGDTQANTKNVWDPPRRDAFNLTKQQWLDRTIAWVKTFNGDYTTGPKSTFLPGYGGPLDVPPYVPNYLAPQNGQWEGRMIGTVQIPEILKQLFFDIRQPLPLVLTAKSIYPGGILAVYDREKKLAEGLGAVMRISTRTGPDYPPLVGPVMKFELIHAHRKQREYRSKIRIEVVEQGDSDGNLFAFSDVVQRLSQLPVVCEHGHTVKISGIEEVEQDEYYVEFVVTNSDPAARDNMGEGHWKEGMRSLIKPALDANTMPVQLLRKPDGKGGFRFEVTQIEWNQQTVGDEESNPPPSFIGKTIEDIFFWRNRLGFLTGSRLVMSEADEFFNFYRKTVKQVLDSDPIDRDAGHRKVANLRYAVPLEETLILWTDRTQFVARGEPLLTPKTTSVRVATEFETLSDVEPISTERGIFYAFPSSGRNFTQISQLQRVLDSDAFDAFPSSGQIPRYIRGSVVQMTATSIESVMAVRTDHAEETHTVWVHKWHDRGSQRLLSAWMKFHLGSVNDGTTVNTRVLGMQFIEDDLYLVMERRGAGGLTWHLEKITFSGQRQVDVFPMPSDPAGSTTTSGTFRCFLDRRITNNECTYAFDSATDELKITLPYEVQDDPDPTSGLAEMRVIQRAPDLAEGLELRIESQAVVGGVTVLRIKDVGQVLFDKTQAVPSTFHVFIGQSYTMTYEFSRPTLRERRRDGSLGDIKTGRYQLLRGYLSLEDSGSGRMEVQPALHTDGTKIVDRNTRTYEFPMLEVGLGHSHLGAVNIRDAVLQFGIYSEPDRIRLVLVNDTPFPLNPKSLELLARSTRRSRIRTT